MILKTAELAVVSNKSFQAMPTADLRHYDLSSALQTSLEFHELISIFCNKIQSLVPHNSSEYSNDEFKLNFRRGVIARHSCSYALQIEDQKLGELKLTRSQRFRKKELETLESLLCCLVYPLRNATLLHQALQKAYTDPLTQTYNRSAFNDILSREIQRANRSKQALSLIFIDVDHFKAINDACGHHCGDMALATVAARIKDSIRGCDVVFRYGGEEFVVLLSDTDLEAATPIAERIRASIESHTLAYGMEALNITASLGISALEDNDDLVSLIERADTAMYKAKCLGRNRICLA